MPKTQDGLLVLSTPCLPKRSYHCGNALSSMVADLLWRAEYCFGGAQAFVVSDAWNLHGLPYEKEFLVRESRVGGYAGIEGLASEALDFAQKEKDSLVKTSDGFVYRDTNPALVAFSRDALMSLRASGFADWRHGEMFLDIDKFMMSDGYASFIEALRTDAVFSPGCHRASVVTQSRVFVGAFPLSKPRVFALRVDVEGRTIALNPIVQSFLYPRWILATYGAASGCKKVLVSASGHGMLKWHYLRSLFSWMLEGRLPVEEFLMHGTVLGTDGSPMSKHASNAISPSALIARCGGASAARFVLLRSISEKDIPLQEARGLKEYRSIRPKLEKVFSLEWRIASEEQARAAFGRIRRAFAARRIHLAIEEWYVWLRHAELSPAAGSATALDRMAVDICALFLSASWKRGRREPYVPGDI